MFSGQPPLNRGSTPFSGVLEQSTLFVRHFSHFWLHLRGSQFFVRYLRILLTWLNLGRHSLGHGFDTMLWITTLHNGMILSTLSISSHVFALDFPKRTNGDSIPPLVNSWSSTKLTNVGLTPNTSLTIMTSFMVYRYIISYHLNNGLNWNSTLRIFHRIQNMKYNKIESFVFKFLFSDGLLLLLHILSSFSCKQLWLWDPISVGEGNKTFFTRVWKSLLNRRVLKTLRENLKGKAQRGQYLLAVGLGC